MKDNNIKIKLIFGLIALTFVTIIGAFVFGYDIYKYWKQKKIMNQDSTINIYSIEELETAFNSDVIKRYLVRGIVPERVSCTITEKSNRDYIFFHEHGAVITINGNKTDYSCPIYYADTLFLTKKIMLTNLKEFGVWNASEYKKIETADSTIIYDGVFASDSLSFLANIGDENIKLCSAIIKGGTNTPIDSFYITTHSDIFTEDIIAIVFALSVLFINVYINIKRYQKKKYKTENMSIARNGIMRSEKSKFAQQNASHSQKKQTIQSAPKKQHDRSKNQYAKKDNYSELILLVIAFGMFMLSFYLKDGYTEAKKDYDRFTEAIKKCNVENLPVIKNIEDLGSAFSSEGSKLYFVDSVACDSVSAVEFEGQKYVYVNCKYFKRIYKGRDVSYEYLSEKTFSADSLYFTEKYRLFLGKNVDFITYQESEEPTDIGQKRYKMILPRNGLSFLAKIGSDSIALVDFDERPIIFNGGKKVMLYNLTEKNLERFKFLRTSFWICISIIPLSITIYILIVRRKKRKLN
jgi:hypothetical protein